MAVVVNADPSAKTTHALQILAAELNWQLVEVPACPGLARQRNLGIATALDLDPYVDLVHFIDDDVLVSESYFVEISRAFGAAPGAVAIGGRDVTTSPVRTTRIGLALGTHSRHEGSLLRSGYNTGFKSVSGLRKVEWLSGCSQSFRMTRLQDVRYDPLIRFYGEEVDMFTRCSERGEILFCADAKFQHLFADEGRQDASDEAFWGDCARWDLCRKYPKRFNRGFLILATLTHMMAMLLSWAIARTPRRLSAASGHARFLLRVLSGTVPRDEAIRCEDPSGARGLPIVHL